MGMSLWPRFLAHPRCRSRSSIGDHSIPCMVTHQYTVVGRSDGITCRLAHAPRRPAWCHWGYICLYDGDIFMSPARPTYGAACCLSEVTAATDRRRGRPVGNRRPQRPTRARVLRGRLAGHVTPAAHAHWPLCRACAVGTSRGRSSKPRADSVC